MKKPSSTEPTAGKPKKNFIKKPQLPEKKNNSFGWKNWLQLTAVLILVFIIYSPALKKEFINFDDNWYIYGNPLFHPFELSNISKIFSEFFGGQYSPLPLTFIGIVSRAAGNETFLFNLSAVLLHLVNICMVCWLVYRMTKSSMTSLMVALLFGVCPLNVESVAWASAVFKIGLYSIFFLGSLVVYTYYLSSSKLKYLAISLLLFIPALLSKEQAVSLVLSLLCVDYFYGRNLLSKKVILEKLPYFILSIAFGIITLIAVKSDRESFTYNPFTFSERILFASYALGEYIVKLFVPFPLSAFYPYPDSKSFSVWFYLHPLIIAVIVFFFLRTVKKHRGIAFGILFFFANILFTLIIQVFSVRAAVMADRYAYVSSIGFFFLAAECLNTLQKNKSKPVVAILTATFVVFLSAVSYARCSVWKNSLTLWNDVIRKSQNIPLAYYNRGIIFMNETKSEEALNDFSNAIRLNKKYTEAYVNRGNVLRDMSRNNDALNDYNKALELKSDLMEAYLNRGNLLVNMNRVHDALEDYNKALQLNPNLSQAYHNRGRAYYMEKRNEAAIQDFSKAIELRPDYADAYFNRGVVEYYSGKKTEACADIKRADNLGSLSAKDALEKICK